MTFRICKFFLAMLLAALFFPGSGVAQREGPETPAAEKTVVANAAYDFEVHYPSNWSASQTVYIDPFDPEAESVSRLEVGVPGRNAPPEGWNRLALRGPGAPFELEIFAHEVAPRPLSELVAALRSRLEEDVRNPTFAVEPDAAWDEHPAWRIVADLGWGRQQYVGVRAGGVRYVFVCTDASAEPTAANCASVLDRHVDLELSEGQAEIVSSLVTDEAALEALKEETEALHRRDRLRASLPDELPGGLLRTVVEVNQPPGALVATARYPDDNGLILLTVGILGAEQLERYRDRVTTLLERGEWTQTTHQGRTVYQGSDGNDRTLALVEDGYMVSLSGDRSHEDLLALFDAVDVERLAAVADER